MDPVRAQTPQSSRAAMISFVLPTSNSLPISSHPESSRDDMSIDDGGGDTNHNTHEEEENRGQMRWGSPEPNNPFLKQLAVFWIEDVGFAIPTEVLSAFQQGDHFLMLLLRYSGRIDAALDDHLRSVTEFAPYPQMCHVRWSDPPVRYAHMIFDYPARWWEEQQKQQQKQQQGAAAGGRGCNNSRSTVPLCVEPLPLIKDVEALDEVEDFLL